MTWTLKNAQKNINCYRVGNFLSSMDFTRGLFLVHLINMGGTNTQSGILQALFFWSTFVFEIPTGVFADRFKRKYSVLIGLFLSALAFLVFAFAESFSIWAFVFVSWGLSVAFQSGAASALLYDGFKELGPKWIAKYTSESAQNRSLSAAALAISMVVGGFVYKTHFEFPFLLCVGTSFLAIVAYGLISEAKKVPVKEDFTLSPDLGKLMKRALFYFFSKDRKSFLFFLIGMALLESWHTPSFIFSQIYLKKLGLSEQFISVFFVANILAASLGLRFMARAIWINQPLNNIKKIVFVSIIPCGFLLFGMTQTQSIPVVLLFITVLNLVPTFLFVLTDKYIQDNLESELRASLLSVQSFLNSCFIGLSFFLGGLIADKYSFQFSYGMLGVLGLVSLVLIYFHKVSFCEDLEKR